MSIYLILKRGGRSYDVVSDRFVVDRIFRPNAGVSKETPWMWSIFIEHRKSGRRYLGNAVDREGTMKEFAAAGALSRLNSRAFHNNAQVVCDSADRDDSGKSYALPTSGHPADGRARRAVRRWCSVTLPLLFYWR
jgi:hypothetical protein